MALHEDPAVFFNNLNWNVSLRDDPQVIQSLISGKAIDGIYNLDERAFMDELMYFLREQGVLEFIQAMEGNPEEIKRKSLDFSMFTTLYLIKTLEGIESMNALPELLFQDEAWMKWAGFNGDQIKNGICDRGKFRQKQKPEGKNDDDAIRGPIIPRTLANNIVKLTDSEFLYTFGKCVNRLAQNGHLPEEVTLILDPSDLEVTERYEGAGSVTRERKIKDKTGKVHIIEVTVFGWKVGVIFEAVTRVPVAFKVARINEPDNHFMKDLVLQAIQNLEPYCKIRMLVVDKGFIDGPLLWWLKHVKGIDFVIPAKSDMRVYEDALALADKYGEDPHCPEIVLKERRRTEKRGKGRNAQVELFTTRVVGVPGLKSYDSYGPAQDVGKHNRKDFEGNSLNAVVVKKWDNKDYGPNKGVVFLTSLGVANPFEAFDVYDDRSLIENCMFREGKQKWDLKHFPQKNERAAQVHVFFVLLAVLLTTLFRRWKIKQEALLEAGQMVGIERYRRQLKAETRDKVIIFSGNRYAILYTQELGVLGGFNLRGAGTREEILRKYGVPP
jgi:hypothetical protein